MGVHTDAIKLWGKYLWDDSNNEQQRTVTSVKIGNRNPFWEQGHGLSPPSSLAGWPHPNSSP